MRLQARPVARKISEPIDPVGRSVPWNLTSQAQPRGPSSEPLFPQPPSPPASALGSAWASLAGQESGAWGQPLLVRRPGRGAIKGEGPESSCKHGEAGPKRVPAPGRGGRRQQPGPDPFPRPPVQGPHSSTIYLQPPFPDVPGISEGRLQSQAPPEPFRACCAEAHSSAQRGQPRSSGGSGQAWGSSVLGTSSPSADALGSTSGPHLTSATTTSSSAPPVLRPWAPAPLTLAFLGARPQGRECAPHRGLHAEPGSPPQPLAEFTGSLGSMTAPGDAIQTPEATARHQAGNKYQRWSERIQVQGVPPTQTGAESPGRPLKAAQPPGTAHRPLPTGHTR
eukprot:XP_023973334.1 basic salivary proline-rich protein 2-like [Physeter catodon]